MKLTKVVEDNHIDRLRKYNYRGTIITVMPDVNNNPWFRAKDISCLLKYSDPLDAIKKHITVNNKKYFRDLKLLPSAESIKINSQIIMINKRGLCQLLTGSKCCLQ